MVSRKDFLGNIVEVGDKVVYNPPHYKGLVIGRVVKITEKRFKILPKSCWDMAENEQERYYTIIAEVVKI